MGTIRHSCNDPACSICKKTNYMKTWREKNKTRLKKYSQEYNQNYYDKNKNDIIEQTKTYYELNKNKVNVRKKEYFEENKDYFSALKKKYWRDNKSILGPKNKKYYEANRKKIINDAIIEKKKRYHSDPAFRLAECIGASLRETFKYSTNKKNNRTTYYVGCSIPFLKKHLTNLFSDGMSWENYGKWHVDHIIPKSAFDTDEESQKKCWNYSNLRPLWAKDNLKKGAKLNYVSNTEYEIIFKYLDEVETTDKIQGTVDKLLVHIKNQGEETQDKFLKTIDYFNILCKDFSEEEKIKILTKFCNVLWGEMTEIRPDEKSIPVGRIGDDDIVTVYPGYVDGYNRAAYYVLSTGDFDWAT